MVEVPDERLQKLTEMITPKKTVPTTFEFTDIAGIVKGASKGEGLGNKFLANIREAVSYTHLDVYKRQTCPYSKGSKRIYDC